MNWDHDEQFEVLKNNSLCFLVTAFSLYHWQQHACSTPSCSPLWNVTLGILPLVLLPLSIRFLPLQQSPRPSVHAECMNIVALYDL